MKTPWFIAVEKFDPSYGENWASYIKSTGLVQLKEVVSLDSCLCPPVIKTMDDEDWKNAVQEFRWSDCFYNLEYLLERTNSIQDKQILAIVKNPDVSAKEIFNDKRFEFLGYDLIDIDRYNSALTNCGGYPNAFDNNELSEKGLILKLRRAKEIQECLLKEYPEDPHADCDIVAIWKMITEPHLSEGRPIARRRP